MADLKKIPSGRRSTSGKYMDMVLEKQMSGFHLALRSNTTAKERSSAKTVLTKQILRPNKAK